jgi:hypothetical protein
MNIQREKQTAITTAKELAERLKQKQLERYRAVRNNIKTEDRG